MTGTILHDYLTFEDLADEAKVSVRTVRRWTTATSPGLAVTHIGRNPYIHRDDLKAWLATRRTALNHPTSSRRPAHGATRRTGSARHEMGRAA